MEKKLDRRVIYTKRVLRESLVGLMADKPINKISVKEICEMADVNRATFYAHYTSQFDLLSDIEQGLIDGIDRYLSEYGVVAPRPATAEMIHKILEYVQENAALFKLFLDPSGLLGFQQNLERLVGRHFLATPIFEQHSREETDYLAQFFVCGAVGIMQKWLRDGMTTPVKDLAIIISTAASGRHSILS